MKNLTLTTHNSQLTTKLAIILALTIACLFLPQATQAATYYLDAVNGLDANPGTSDQPWQTLARAYTWYSGAGTKVQEGDTVLLRNGEYGSFYWNASYPNQPSTRTDWITYKAVTGHTPDFNNINIYDARGGYSDGNSYLVFDGIHITDGVLLTCTNYITFQNCEVELQPVAISGYYEPYFATNSYAFSCVAMASGVNNLIIQNCNIHSAKTCIGLYGSNILVKNNTLHHFSDVGVSLPTNVADNVLVEGNLIYDNRPNTCPARIQGTKDGNFIPGEVVTLVTEGATGIAASWSAGDSSLYAYSPGKVVINDFYDSSHSRLYDPNDYLFGATSGAKLTNITVVDRPHIDGIMRDAATTITNLVVRKNTIDFYRYVGIGSESIGKPFKFIGRSPGHTYLTFENNLIRTYGWGMFAGLSDAVINNNTFLGAHGTTIYTYPPYSDTVVNELYNNIIERLTLDNYASGHTVNIISHGNNIFKTTPYILNGVDFAVNGTERILGSDQNLEALFVNFDTDGNGTSDFRLTPGSLATDFGNPNYGPKTDILGNMRDAQPDAGAYEYGATSSTATGDINGDGSVDAIDLQLLINMILSGSFDSKADLNKDSSVDAIDLQALVNIILAG